MDEAVVFMFPGQGSQYFHAGRDLYEQDRSFRDDLDRLDELIFVKSGHRVLPRLYDSRATVGDAFDDLRATHPAIFMLQYSLAQLLIRRDIHPHYVLGMSMGEFAAATVAGAIEFEDALDLLLEQALLLPERCCMGGMLAVLGPLSLYEQNPALKEYCELVSVNGPEHFVVSGKAGCIGQVASILKASAIPYQRLPVQYAFHSALIDQAADVYRAFAARKKGTSLQVPLASCAEGRILRDTVPNGHWWNVVRQPIRAVAAVRELERLGRHIYVDFGPGGTLAALLRQNAIECASCYVVMTPFHHETQRVERVRAAVSGRILPHP